MADIFEVAPGWNNAGALTAFPFAPDTDGIYFPRQFTPASGRVQNDGKPLIQLRFPSIMREDVAQATLALMDLEPYDEASALVTVRLPVNVRLTSWANFNGIALRFIPGKSIRHAYCWYEQPVILITRLEAL